MDTVVQQKADLAKSSVAADSALAASTAARQASANVQPSAAALTGTVPTGAASVPPTPRTRIYYNPELAEFSLGEDHPMVPNRLHLTHRLAELWGLFDDPAVQVIQDYPPATTDQLRRFHTDEYVAFLEYIDTLDLANMTVEQQQSLLGEDLALFGLSVCRPPGSAQEEEAGPALAAGPGPGSANARSEARQQQPQRQRSKSEGEQAARQGAGVQQGTRQEAKPAAGALVPWGSGAGGGGGPTAAVAPATTEPLVPPQVVTLAIHLLAKLTPQGSAPLSPAQQQQLLTYLRQHHLQYQQRNPQPAARALAPVGPARPAVTMVRPGQAPPPAGKAAQQGGGGGGSNKKRKQDSGKGQGSGKGKRKSKSRKRRSSYSDDDDEDEEISDEDDDSPIATAEVPAAAPAPAGCSARPSRQAATAVAALTNAVRATEAEESEDEESEDEDDDDDDDEGGDCPIFPGLLRYVGLQAAGSILAARDLASGVCDVAVHWGGGMHHGMPYRAFGFCYVNDLVLAILELMAGCGRVLYIDVDVHHGDGVETAFKRSEKVMSISLHKWDDGRMQASIDTLNHGKPQRPVFFPGTGKKNDLGEGAGKYYTVNVPLQDDITDESYLTVYRAVVKTAFERFKPQAVVLQCGCDSVAGDKLGRFNLSIRGHSKCVELVRDLCRSGGCEGAPTGGTGAGRGGASPWRIPLLVTGGGGYTPPLVARCWALETAVLLGRELGETMPPSVMQAPDLVDLGPSYFKEAELSRPPKGPYSMCLDTIMLPGAHKQMDSDYSLSRLAGYLTSNMQRVTIKDTNPPPPAIAAAPAGGDHAAEDDGAEPHHTAGGAEAAKDGAVPAPAAAAAAVAGSSKSRSRKSAAAAASGPGVADPLRHLTAPTGYPDAEEYIAEQKERVTAGAPWAAKMPPPPAPKGRKAIAAAAAAAAATAAKPAGGTTLAAVRSNTPTTAPGLGKPIGLASGVAVKQEATAVGASIPQIPVMPYIPGLPTILPYKPKVSVTTGGGTPAAAPSAAK